MVRHAGADLVFSFRGGEPFAPKRRKVFKFPPHWDIAGHFFAYSSPAHCGQIVFRRADGSGGEGVLFGSGEGDAAIDDAVLEEKFRFRLTLVLSFHHCLVPPGSPFAAKSFFQSNHSTGRRGAPDSQISHA
jgi:hypothetical protein